MRCAYELKRANDRCDSIAFRMDGWYLKRIAKNVLNRKCFRALSTYKSHQFMRRKKHPEYGRSIKAVKFEYLENLKILIALENDNLNTFSVHFIVSNEWNCEIRHKRSRILSIDCIIIIDIFNSTDIRNIARNSSRAKKMCSTAHIEQIGQKPWDGCAIDWRRWGMRNNPERMHLS